MTDALPVGFPTVAVVIPTLNAGKEIGHLLKSLEAQTVVPDEILVIDSCSDDNTDEQVANFPGVMFKSISRAEFNHGATRDLGVKCTSSELICFLTQDAVPASEQYLENLISPLVKDSQIALASGRQLPKSDARRFEQLVREFNYPDEASVRSLSDIERYGIKTFFASDVCSCYRRSAFVACGGFGLVNTSEDMLMAARLIGAGYKVAYAPDAAVFHSHNLTPRQQYYRNKEVGFFLEVHKKELLDVRETAEGVKLAVSVSKQLFHERRYVELISFGIDCAARFVGNRKGRSSGRRALEGESR